MLKFILICLSVMLISCSTVSNNGRSDASVNEFGSVVMPKWGEKTGTFKEGKNLFAVGCSSDMDNEQNARDAAFSNGFSELAMYFGVNVKSTLTDFQRNSDGEYSYDVSSKSEISSESIKISRFVKADEFILKKNGKYTAKVLVKISQKEADRIEKELKGITAWNIYIKDAAYENSIADFVKKYASVNKINLGNKIAVKKDSSIDDISKLADTAYFLGVDVSWSDVIQEGKGFFTRVKVTLTIYSLTDKKEIKSIIKEIKWGEYTPENSIEKGIKRACNEILEEESM